MDALKILLSDERLLAISKPPGVPFHAEGKEEGILQIVRRLEADGTIEKGERLYPVHRLDRITSGVLLFARGRKTANLLSNEFRHNRVEKIYMALSLRPPSRKQGSVMGDLVKSRNGTYRLIRTTNQPAVTRFISIPVKKRRGLYLFLLKPRTGKTHQIRVTLKSLSSPILGDPLYSRFDEARAEKRGYLHACALRITLEGKLYTFFDPPSGGEFDAPEVKDAWKRLGNLFELKWPGDRAEKKGAHARR